MSAASLAQMLVFAAVLVTAGYVLGAWMARVFSPARRAGPVERGYLRLIRADGPQGWRAYATSLLVFSGVSLVTLFLGLLAPCRS